jgi:hypothetical protein
MRVGHYFSLVLASIIGCVFLFAACDRQLLVAGHVFDSQHRPLGHATVEVNGVKTETNESGCFYFGEVSGGPDLNLRVAKLGSKQYQDSKELSTYNIVVTLVQENSEQQSSAVWQRSMVGEISRYKDCSD